LRSLSQKGFRMHEPDATIQPYNQHKHRQSVPSDPRLTMSAE
jgi:hypothetical protein